jgi:predicted enzyme related to lactoylglutathione lyase
MADPVHFKRAALIVADLDRALAVYRDAIGLKLQSIKNSAADSYSYEIFGIDPAVSLRMAALDAAPGQERALALIEARPLPAHHVGPRAATVLNVTDIDAVAARLAATPGVRLFPERPLHTHDGRIGRELAAIDPDGHALVLYQL